MPSVPIIIIIIIMMFGRTGAIIFAIGRHMKPIGHLMTWHICIGLVHSIVMVYWYFVSIKKYAPVTLADFMSYCAQKKFGFSRKILARSRLCQCFRVRHPCYHDYYNFKGTDNNIIFENEFSNLVFYQGSNERESEREGMREQNAFWQCICFFIQCAHSIQIETVIDWQFNICSANSLLLKLPTSWIARQWHQF